jgi:hypothetical protein
MSYNYSQLHDIIELQYAQKQNENEDWFLEESIKFGKGYINPKDYANNLIKNIYKLNNKNDLKDDTDKALYLHH